MAEPEALKPTADRRAVHTDLVLPFQFHTQFIQRQVALLGQPPANPTFQPQQLAGAP